MGVLRNKILLCPLSALGFYFFWRWGFLRRQLPSFHGPDNYYSHSGTGEWSLGHTNPLAVDRN